MDRDSLRPVMLQSDVTRQACEYRVVLQHRATMVVLNLHPNSKALGLRSDEVAKTFEQKLSCLLREKSGWRRSNARYLQ
jgi:hypothetical protein